MPHPHFVIAIFIISLSAQIRIQHSSKFSWHDVFINFIIRCQILKMFFMKIFWTVCSGHQFTMHYHKFLLYNFWTTTFLDHENLDLYGTHISDYIIWLEIYGNNFSNTKVSEHYNTYNSIQQWLCTLCINFLFVCFLFWELFLYLMYRRKF